MQVGIGLTQLFCFMPETATKKIKIPLSFTPGAGGQNMTLRKKSNKIKKFCQRDIQDLVLDLIPIILL